MRKTLDLPDDVMVPVKVRAAIQNRRREDIITEALRRDLGLADACGRSSVRGNEPAPAGRPVPHTEPEDRLEDMLDARGHRY